MTAQVVKTNPSRLTETPFVNHLVSPLSGQSVGGGDAVHGSLPIIQSMCLSWNSPNRQTAPSRIATNGTGVLALCKAGSEGQPEWQRKVQHAPRTPPSVGPSIDLAQGGGASSSFDGIGDARLKEELGPLCELAGVQSGGRPPHELACVSGPRSVIHGFDWPMHVALPA